MTDLDQLVTSLCVKYKTDDPQLKQCVKTLKRTLDCDDDEEDDCVATAFKKTKLQCRSCGKMIAKTYFRTHTSLHCKTRNTVFPCNHCSKTYNTYDDLFQHVDHEHPLNQTGGGRKRKHRTKRNVFQHVGSKQKQRWNESALNKNACKHFMIPRKNERYDMITFFVNIKDEVIEYLGKKCRKSGQLKFYMIVHVQMIRQRVNRKNEEATPYFTTSHILVAEDSGLEHNINVAFRKMFKALDEFIRKGSSWTLKKITKLEIHTATYRAIGGKSYIQLPPNIRSSKSVINIKNKDNKCFLWSVLASLHPAEYHAERVKQYKRFENDLNMNGIEYPVHPSAMHKFEKQNNISVTVIAYEEGRLFPIYISKLKNGYHHQVNLLYFQKNDDHHWCLIKNLDRFLYHTKPSTHKYNFCHLCLQSFRSEEKLSNHLQYCSQHDAQRTIFQTKGVDDILKYSDFRKQMFVPFVIYCDFETLNRKMDTCYPDPLSSSTTEEAKCIPCGYGYKVVCEDSKYTKKTVIYRGENVAEHFLKSLMRERCYIKDILSHIEPLVMTDEDEDKFQKATHCHICEIPFTSSTIRCKDHNHLTSAFVGASCQSCNLNYKQATFIPVISHGLTNFDSHIICSAMGLFKNETISCIAKSTEKYISFSVGSLKFIDSYQFLSASLEKLIESCEREKFELLSQEIDKAHLLFRKGVYPYDYMDDFDKVKENRLPAREKFYNKLTRTHISQEDYEYAQQVWNEFNINTMGDYHDLYLKTDVLTLACVFQNFRSVSMSYYKLDPCQYVSLPGLSLAACLKMTKVELELLTDPDMYLFFEKAIRGGLSVVSKRYAEANNPYLPDTYDAEKPNSYIIYQDCVNLYVKSMKMNLPVNDFRWLNEEEINNFNIHDKTENDETGCVLEVDLTYDKSIHDFTNDLPLAPEKKEITNDMLSPYTKSLLEHLNQRRVSSTKLIASVENKSRYILDYRALKLYMRLGLKLTKIHKILSFHQKAWLQPYIDFNTQKRKESTSEFLRNFFKLINNSCYGKFIENVRKYMNFKLIHTEQRFRREVARTNFQHFTVFDEDLVGVSLSKVELKLNKPIYCGMIILDLSKVIMYTHFYDNIKREYGNRVSLCATDTDSLIMHIKTEDVYSDFANQKHLYDLSNYNKDHFLYDNTNKGKIGTFKDETQGLPIHEFVGLRSKMYCYTCPATSKKEHPIAKGVKKSTLQSSLSFQKYYDCLFEKTQTMCNMNLIKSDKHRLHINRLNKIGLCGADDKRWVLNDGIQTLAHGHYKTKDNS